MSMFRRSPTSRRPRPSASASRRSRSSYRPRRRQQRRAWGGIVFVAGLTAIVLLGVFFSVQTFKQTTSAPTSNPVLTASAIPPTGAPAASSTAVSSPTVVATATATPSQEGATALPDLTPTLGNTAAPEEPTGDATTTQPLDIPSLQEYMLALINADRQARGLSALGWDGTAAIAGLRHAQEMARYGYTSHLDLDGRGPDYRYALAGGLDAVQETVYTFAGSHGGGPASAEDWQRLVEQAQQELVQSKAYGTIILSPQHTKVGVGIAYSRDSARLAIVQEFVDQYATLDPLPYRAAAGDQMVVAGRLAANVANPQLDLAYEPLPAPGDVAALKPTGPFESPAVAYQSNPLPIDERGQFNQTVVLGGDGRPGLYHIRVSIETASGRMLAADAVIEVQ